MHSIIPLRSQTPSTTTTVSSGPTLSELADLFRAADSDDRCDEAASAFAVACGGFEAGALRELLSGLPAEAPLSVLCEKLADALLVLKVTSAAIWNDLLHFIKSDPRVAIAQLALYQQCAKCLAYLRVTDATLWGELAAIPLHSPDELVQAGAQIAASMESVGMEEPVLWDTLIAAMTQVSDGSQAGHEQMAQGPVQARGCNAPDLGILVIATSRPTLGEQRQADLWTSIGRVALQLDANSLHGFFDGLRRFGTPNPLPAVAWDKLFEVASARGVDALGDFALVQDRFERTRLERTLRLALEKAGGGDGRALISIASTLDPTEESHRDLWLLLLMRADDVEKLDPGSGFRLLCVIRRHDSMLPQSSKNELLIQLTQRVFEALQQSNSLDDLLEFAVTLGATQWSTPTFERILEITGPTPHRGDIERVLAAMQEARMAFTSPLMRRLPEAMSDQTALQLLPFMLSICQYAGHDEREQAPLSLLVLTLEKAVRISGKDALRALVAFRTAPLGQEALFRGPQSDADTLTALLMRLVYGTELDVHPAFPLGSWHLCNLLLNTQAEPLEDYARPYLAMIRNAIVDGALRLDQIEEIQAHRDLVRRALPTIHWDMVFNPGADAPKTRVQAGLPALSSEYVVSLISPDDASNLILGHKVSCEGAPQGTRPEMMLERLIGGWVVWSIANTAGDTAAVAWATLNKEQDLVIDSVDAGLDFRELPLGNELMEALLAFGPKVATAIRAQRVFVAAPKEGWHVALDTFKRPTHPHDFSRGVPRFMGRNPYTDSINRRAVSYFSIDPQ